MRCDRLHRTSQCKEPVPFTPVLQLWINNRHEAQQSRNRFRGSDVSVIDIYEADIDHVDLNLTRNRKNRRRHLIRVRRKFAERGDQAAAYQQDEQEAKDLSSDEYSESLLNENLEQAEALLKSALADEESSEPGMKRSIHSEPEDEEE